MGFFKSLHPKVVASTSGVALVAATVGILTAVGVTIPAPLLALSPVAAMILSFAAGYIKKGPMYLGEATALAGEAVDIASTIGLPIDKKKL